MGRGAVRWILPDSAARLVGLGVRGPGPSGGSASGRTQVCDEPVLGEGGDRFESAGFLKEVRGTGDDREIMFAAQLSCRVTVELDHHVVIAAHNEERRRAYLAQPWAGEVGTAPS